MKILLISLISSFLYSAVCYASQPYYYSFNKVLLTEGGITIKVSTKSEGALLESFSINTPNGTIKLIKATLEQVMNPKLDTIKMALMPYELKQGLKYFHEVSMTFYGEKICKSDDDSLNGARAPKSKIVIVFWGEKHEIRFEHELCNA